MTVQRDYYNAIDITSLPTRTANQVKKLVQECQDARKVDEHGGWEFGAEWGKYDRKANDEYGNYRPAGWACNWDLYGTGRDYHNKKFLALIQIRQTVREKRCYYMQIRKNYFLIGRNEDGSAFAHCVEGRTIHNAIKRGKDPIKAVQDWIFGGHDYKKVIRQGDMGLLSKKPRGRGTRFGKGALIIESSHILRAEAFLVQGEKLYVYNARMRHQNGVHPTIHHEGWALLLVGRRAAAWSFAAPTID